MSDEFKINFKDIKASAQKSLSVRRVTKGTVLVVIQDWDLELDFDLSDKHALTFAEELVKLVKDNM